MMQLLVVFAAGSIVVNNKYTTELGPIGSQYPWLDGRTIVDAWAPWWCELVVNENVVDANWTLVGASTERWTGTKEMEIGVGEYMLEASYGQHQESTRLLSMYVRREYRDLDDEDRIRLTRAMRVLYDTNTSAGVSMGSDYLGMDFLVRLHHETAAQRDADHMHQGAGFLAQHAKLTVLMEQSLRLVDRTVGALPYWDPTIEADGDIWDTPMWTADWFGSIGGFQGDDASYDSETWAIQDGLWAMLRSPLRPKWWLPSNAYGYLRAPWNNNPSPYVTRFPHHVGKFPNCTTHRKFAESLIDERGGDSWLNRSGWMYDVENKAHSMLHNTPGGLITIGDRNLVAESVMKANGIDSSMVKQHTLWRFRVIDFPDDCDVLDECAPRCNLALWTNLTAVGYEIVKAQSYLPSPADLARLSADNYTDIAKAYCGLFDELDVDPDLVAASRRGPEILISGDPKDSGGSIDPSFWPIHPTMTRLYQYRLLFGPGFEDESWRVDHSCFGARSDDEDPDRLAFALDGANVGNSTLGLPPSDNYNPDGTVPCGFQDCCAGHFASSRLFQRYPDVPFGLTNAEMLDLIDPRTGPTFEQPIYHHFRFSHCEERGVHFKSTDAR